MISPLLRTLCLFIFSAFSVSLAWSENESNEEDAPFREQFVVGDAESSMGVAQAVRVGGVVFVSATTGPGSDVETQLKTIYLRIQSSLGYYGASINNIVNERIYTTDMNALEAAEGTRRRFYQSNRLPTSSWLEVQRLREDWALVAVEVMAVLETEE